MTPTDSAHAPTTRFRRQHEELMTIAKELTSLLDTRALAQDATTARRVLATFTGKLRIHAAMEDEALYPRLLACGDADVVAKASTLRAEVGDLYQSFFAFIGRWSTAEQIQKDPESFGRETMQELYRLGKRMKKENNELYPLVDARELSGAA